MTYGFVKIGKGIREQKYLLPILLPDALPLPCSTANASCSELAREKMWARIHLIPLLQAEEDRDLVRRHFADLAREKELMGRETSAYNGERYVDAFLQFWVSC